MRRQHGFRHDREPDTPGHGTDRHLSGPTTAASSRLSIRTSLFGLAGAAVVAWAAMNAVAVRADYAEARARAGSEARLLAELAADEMDGSGVRGFLDTLVQDPVFRGQRPEACSSLAALAQESGAYVALLRGDGTVTCSTDRFGPGATSLATPALATEPHVAAVLSGRSSYGTAFGADPLTGDWGESFAVPVMSDPPGALIGTLFTDSREFDDVVAGREGVEVLLVHAPDGQAPTVVGRSAGTVEAGAGSLATLGSALEGAVATGPDLDGRNRIFALAPTGFDDVHAAVGLLESTALAPARDALRTAVANTAVFAAAVAALVALLNRRLARPIRELLATIDRAAAGDRSARAPVRGPAELAQLAAEYNAMAEIRVEADAKLAYQALHDPMTGLPNRTLFNDRVATAVKRASRSGRFVAVVMLDVDRFKLINDSLGHDAGDLVLHEVARRLGETVRPGDTVARLSGDEFALLLEDLPGTEEATRLAHEIAAAVAAPVAVGFSELVVTVSTGIALGSAGADAADLVRNADAALHQAKDDGGSRAELFHERHRRSAIDRLTMEADLRRTIEEQELSLAYQPIVSVADGRIAGAEALCRWTHPVRGPVSPAEFVAVAEECGLVAPLGRWVIGEACAQLARWRRGIAGLGAFTMSVNVSGRQLDAELIDVITTALATTGADPADLQLEITESVLIRDLSGIDELLAPLRQLGVRIAIDDFGTGYSSLSYLGRLPADTVKVDGSLVARLPDDDRDLAVVRAVVELAHALDLSVVAEGVETDAQRDTLRGLGCDLAQGYLFQRPAPASTVESLLRAARPSGTMGGWLTPSPRPSAPRPADRTP